MKINKTYIAPAVRIKTINLTLLQAGSPSTIPVNGDDSGNGSAESKGLSLFGDDAGDLFN